MPQHDENFVPDSPNTAKHHLPLDLPEFALETGEQRTVTWSVPWSDLMMVMFILFLVLFVFSLREKDRLILSHKTSASIPTVSSSSAQLNMLPLFEVLRERLLGHERTMHVVFHEDASIVISLFGDNLFLPETQEIDHRSELLLSKIGQTISLAQGNIVITGFADTQTSNQDQTSEKTRGTWEIAALRAAAVAEHFVHETGLNPDMLIIQATGAERPLAPHFQGQQNSRRFVEIRIEP